MTHKVTNYRIHLFGKTNWLGDILRDVCEAVGKGKQKTFEQITEQKRQADAEELRRLRNLKRNIESGIVFSKNITPELMEILETYETKDL